MILLQQPKICPLSSQPENLESIWLSAYSLLLKEKAKLEDELKTDGKEIERWVELTEKTFNFACYAQTWFKHGDLETRRAIFACLGSDFLLKDQKVAITLQEPLKIIFERKNAVEQEFDRLEPLNFGSIYGKSDAFASEFPLMSGLVDQVRTCLMNEKIFHVPVY